MNLDHSFHFHFSFPFFSFSFFSSFFFAEPFAFLSFFFSCVAIFSYFFIIPICSCFSIDPISFISPFASVVDQLPQEQQHQHQNFREWRSGSLVSIGEIWEFGDLSFGRRLVPWFESGRVWVWRIWMLLSSSGKVWARFWGSCIRISGCEQLWFVKKKNSGSS